MKILSHASAYLNYCSDIFCACRFAEDYRVALQKSYAWTNQVPPDVPDTQGFIVRPRHRQRQSVRVKIEVLTLSFWCLSPAVVRGQTWQILQWATLICYGKLLKC